MAVIPNFIVMLHHHIRKDERQRIEIRVHYNRLSKYYKTELFIHPEHFNPSGQLKMKKGKKEVFIEDSWILSSYHKYHEYNRIIINEIERLKKAWRKLKDENKPITAQSIILKANEVNTGSSIIPFINLELKEKRLSEQYQLSHTYRDAFKKLFLFFERKIDYNDTKHEFSGEDFFIDELTNEKIREFKIYLLTTDTKRGKPMAASSIALYFSIIKAVLVRNPNYSEYIIKQFKGISFSYETEKAQKLTPNQILELWNLDLRDKLSLQEAVEVFLFCYFCQGIRIGEAMLLKVKDYENGRVIVEVEKSGRKKKFRDILLSKKATILIEKYIEGKSSEEYIFPFLKYVSGLNAEAFRKKMDNAIVVINENLKKVAKLLEWDITFSTHSARGSFISESANQGDIYKTSQGIGHAEVRTTEGYSKINHIRLDTLNEVYKDE
ncbi:tyrosine-type recombinase/integrase [Emticicia sp. C21]|uniref:tyrosine-type recombinase/integrase n=1 Tax=Emticicia sp. C21 TaxID=2302915 RepID=UPI000E354421|nr:tyrosine-type recombinase/integrase [Emticicia sp. C21]RFS16078.1 hypothetical protein D0T08_14410 [Emticicia sp. C21]